MSGGGNFDVSMYRAISSIVIASILFCVEARECMARTNSSCHQYQIAIIAVIAVLFSVIFSGEAFCLRYKRYEYCPYQHLLQYREFIFRATEKDTLFLQRIVF